MRNRVGSRQIAFGIASTGLMLGGCSDSPSSLSVEFDDLGGGSPNILVYPGTGPEFSGMDNGFYRHGTTAVATCVEIGREITSDPSVGEREKSSNVWVELTEVDDPEFDPEVRQFGTIVYLNTTEEKARQLPTCDSLD